jgi:hypothetical protein
LPSGARPGERRGGRARGTPNKYTVGKLWKQRQAYTLDATLTDLSKLLVMFVPDPENRHLLCHAIDRYVDARARATSRQKRLRSAVIGVPRDHTKELVMDFQPLDLNWPIELSLDFDPGLVEY